MKFIDLVGKRFGRLVVVSRDTSSGLKRTRYKCLCDCGTVKYIDSNRLSQKTRPGAKSCGCLSREVAAARQLKAQGASSFTALYHRYRRSARLRNISFDLTRDKVAELFKGDCFYCGRLPDRSYSLHRRYAGRRGIRDASPYIYNGIDRLDNTAGYTVYNAVPCCWQCNQAKGTLTLVEFLSMVERVAANRDKLMNKLSGDRVTVAALQ